MSKRRTTQGMGDLFVFGDEIEPLVETSPPPGPIDQAERDQALDITRSWIVEAPAGSGKTGLLIQRYLKLLAQPGVQQPEQVLAITFTLKAAGEIRDRILVELENAAKSFEENVQAKGFALTTLDLARAVIERDRQLGWNLLSHPRRLNLRTIDSVSAEIARGLPVLSGGSGLTPVENAGALHRLAAERTLLQLGGADERLSAALGLLLLHRDGELQKLRDLLAEMLMLRDQWGRLIPLGRQSLDEQYLDTSVLPQLESALAKAICIELTSAERSIPSHLLERLSALAAEMGDNEGYNGTPSPIKACAGKYSLPGAIVDDLERWRGLMHLLINKSEKFRLGFNRRDLQFETTKKQRAQLKEVVGALEGRDDLIDTIKRVLALPPATYPPEQWRVAKSLFFVLYRALIELQLVFAERGECDFTELGLLARAALNHTTENEDNALKVELQHLLVDEMQDTSTSQYELIQLLTQGWDGQSQTVFLVGDPKQSIYLFRQARVERFIRTMKELRLGDLDLGSLKLKSNFRSQPGLVQSFNETFSRLFPSDPAEDRPEEVPYVEVSAVRAPSDAQHLVWHPQIISANSPDETAAEKRRLAQMEAIEVRHIIERWRSRPLPDGRNEPWKIAVLVRNRSHLTQIVAELKRDEGAGAIPFRAVDIEPLGERPEVLDLFALTRALLHPADRVAWLSVLRSPWCGLELSDLHILCGEDDPVWSDYTVIELIEERGQLLSSQGAALLQRVGPLLTAVNKQLARMPLSELVERTWRSFGGDVYLTHEQKTNAERYFNLLDEAERQEATIDVDLLQRQLRRLYAAPSTTAGAVDLMTIHGAKGLEWDLVLLPGLEKRSHGDGQRLLMWEELSTPDQGSAQVILAPIAGKGRDSEALNDWLRGIHRRREAAECRRLLYVACTRAREELHLFATLKRGNSGSLYPFPGTLLSAAWPAAEQHFVDSTLPSKPVIAPVVTMKQTASSMVLPALAAEEKAYSVPATLYRLPIGFFLPRKEAVIPKVESPDVLAARTFERPEGSFESRASGHIVHLLLDLLAQRIASHSTTNDLLGEIANWQPRIEALLRNQGLSSSTAQRLVGRVQSALETTLRDPEGLWLIGARKDAVSEYALIALEETRSSVRLDRIFRSGPSPLTQGEEYLWIVDFKTAPHAGVGLEEFLKNEKQKYAAQMQSYAQIVRAEVQPGMLRLGLYYPLLPKLVWWVPVDESQREDA